jgi:hypothetical protein
MIGMCRLLAALPDVLASADYAANALIRQASALRGVDKSVGPGSTDAVTHKTSDAWAGMPLSTGVFIDDIGVFIDDIGVFIDDIASFIDDIASFIDDIASFIDDIASFIDDIASFIDDISVFIDAIRICIDGIGILLGAYSLRSNGCSGDELLHHMPVYVR